MAEFKKIKGSLDIDIKLKAFEKEKKDLPLILANLAKNHFLIGFRRGGYQTDDSRNGWKKRRFEDKGRAILVKSGKLRRDIKVRHASFKRTVVGTSSLTGDYADAHNKGTKYNVSKKQRGFFISKYNETSGAEKAFWKSMIGAQTINIPKREFIGNSTELERKIKKKIISEINKLMKSGR